MDRGELSSPTIAENNRGTAFLPKNFRDHLPETPITDRRRRGAYRGEAQQRVYAAERHRSWSQAGALALIFLLKRKYV